MHMNKEVVRSRPLTRVHIVFIAVPHLEPTNKAQTIHHRKLHDTVDICGSPHSGFVAVPKAGLWQFPQRSAPV